MLGQTIASACIAYAKDSISCREHIIKSKNMTHNHVRKSFYSQTSTHYLSMLNSKKNHYNLETYWKVWEVSITSCQKIIGLIKKLIS
jgi:hypothetical protein